MEPHVRGFGGVNSGAKLEKQRVMPFRSGQNLVIDRPRYENTFVDDHRLMNYNFLQPGPALVPLPKPRTVIPPSVIVSSHEEEYPEDCDFSDDVLRYMSNILMEEDMEDKTCMVQDSLELQAAEKSLYDVLGEKYPPSPKEYSNYESQEGNTHGTYSTYANSSSDNSSRYFVDYNAFRAQTVGATSTSLSSFSSSNSATNGGDGPVESPDSIIRAPDLFNDSQSAWNFRKGVEEANKFLPTDNDLFLRMEVNGLLNLEPIVKTSGAAMKVETKEEGDYSPNRPKGKRNPHTDDVDSEEERSKKQAAVYPDSIVRSEIFDEVLLCPGRRANTAMSSLRDSLQNGINKNVKQIGQTKGSSGTKGRGGGKKSAKKEIVDLRTLMMSCAQAVAADDRRNASELLKQIRQHSSPYGDGNQRLAHYFADGFQARLAGAGSQIYKGLISKRTSATDILKAYKLYVAACPFRKLSHFVSNRTVINLSAKATRLHIIDFGIAYGFQWPTFIQRLSTRDVGPPMLRITGIDFPQPGFRPAERVEETGRRLADYAKSFKVPFEFNAIAKKWETIQIEELNIQEDEVLVVTSIYRFKNLHDESVAADSSRSIVLNMIRKINPDIFMHGIVNGAYNAPFFVTRFREALFHFSAIYDMLETIVPREFLERTLIEREIFGREALNVIACEGWERVERPETYKQWQVRNLRAGFRQIPFDREVMKRATNRVKSNYHKDFLIDEDSQWFLQGWKGRIIYALSCWKPA